MALKQFKGAEVFYYGIAFDEKIIDVDEEANFELVLETKYREGLYL